MVDALLVAREQMCAKEALEDVWACLDDDMPFRSDADASRIVHILQTMRLDASDVERVRQWLRYDSWTASEPRPCVHDVIGRLCDSIEYALALHEDDGKRDGEADGARKEKEAARSKSVMTLRPCALSGVYKRFFKIL